ncbi:hypothetical protein DL93DRAFT_2227450 [Clavulina sp. PMI_390]|nr:hypothetical protein DL93DRAFT_2227450 [Clavulina sp. PMI_390]
MSSAVTAATPLRSRIPQTPSASFPSVFIPHLPKTGTARLRLRSNAIGLVAILSRPPSQPISLDTSSPLSTPTRARGSSSPLRFSRFSSASSHVLGTDVTLSMNRSFDGYPSSSLSSHPGKAFNASMIEKLLDTSDE